jgi:hypothetical protein
MKKFATILLLGMLLTAGLAEDTNDTTVTNLCGDGVCDITIEETCLTCVEDCAC